ncbi:MAG: HD domain-containing protein [Bacteroidales bacterium]
MIEYENLIAEAEKFVGLNSHDHDGGHDWWHIKRVRDMAMYIHSMEKSGDTLVVELGALLHDVGDSKFLKTTLDETNRLIIDFLFPLDVTKNVIDQVLFINNNISFSKGKKPESMTPEFMIVQDADRLDAIGAIGIARAFNYGGFRNNPIFDPSGKEKTTIDHFADKLLKLKDMMNTDTARELASERHEYMEKFLRQFAKEVTIGRDLK